MKRCELLLPAGLVLVASTASAADLRVRLEGLLQGGGYARAALFETEHACDADQRFSAVRRSVDGDSVVLVFRDVAPGTCGVSADQDVNGNRELDTHFLGIPSKPYGFSNNTRASLAKPVLDALAFEVGDDSLELEIGMISSRPRREQVDTGSRPNMRWCAVRTDRTSCAPPSGTQSI